MEYLIVEALKSFPKSSLKGLAFGAGVGLISIGISTNFGRYTHLLAHNISGLISLMYLGLSMNIFMVNGIFDRLKFLYKLYEYSRVLQTIIFVLVCFLLNLPMLKLEDEITLFFTRCIDSYLGFDNSASYFLGFIICYSMICFLLAGLVEIMNEYARLKFSKEMDKLRESQSGATGTLHPFQEVGLQSKEKSKEKGVEKKSKNG